MASVSIQARVDGAAWKAIKGKSTHSEALQKVVAHYVATGGDTLSDIAPTPDAAIAVLRHSHTLLTSLISNSAIAIPQASTPSTTPTASTETTTDALSQADEW